MRDIEGYEIIGLLGVGGMCRVFKVRSPMEDGPVLALKLLAPHPHLLDLLGLEDIQRRFRSEIDILARIDHPHVVKLISSKLDGTRRYAILEYHCRTVSEWIGEGPRVEEPTRPLRPDLALAVVRQTALALRALHERGLIHRDVKPANLLLDARKTVKLTDFGFSKLRGEREIRPPQLMVGSPFYAPPEQEQNPEAVGPQADWYSLGVVFHRLVCGKLPAGEADDFLFREAYGPAGQDFLTRMLATAPAQRPANAANVLGALDEMEEHWEKRRMDICRMRLLGRNGSEGKQCPESLRSWPIKIGGKQARLSFPVNELWRPTHGSRAQLVLDGEIIQDRAANRLWQRSGSEQPLDRQGAREYIQRLNRDQRSGRCTWRLPTAEELLSLLEPGIPLDDFCLQPVFDRRQHRLWSADRRSFISAWIVDVESGYLGWQDFTCPAYVRAVSNAG